ncbi:Lauroyl/myristoyl acyltransferase [Candidatus Magnetoovum chiemensis]|nr:Lauroyl/myristoyl acyltransferase [Candidatus Magnetoovum chiemensis]
MIVKESVFRDALRLIVWYPVRWLLLTLPVRAGIEILKLMGDVHFTLAKGKRESLTRNLKNLSDYSKAQADSIVRDYLRNHYIDHLLIFLFPRFDKKFIARYIEIKGLDKLDKALENKSGAILVHGHLGPVHVPLVALARLGYKMKQIGNPTDEGLSFIGKKVAFRLRMKYEAMIPAEIIKADAFLRPVFKWLNSNGVIMITGDGSGTQTRIGKHELFTFFAKDVVFPMGPAILAQKTKAALIPMFITAAPKKLWRITIEDPISGDGSAAAVTNKFVKRLQHYINDNPSYMHFLDRFSDGCIINNK